MATRDEKKEKRLALPPLICPTCKGRFYPKQQWMHAKCKVVLMMEPATNEVANTEPVVETQVANATEVMVTKVANKSKHGQYKNKEARLAYMRELMRKKRAEAKTGKLGA